MEEFKPKRRNTAPSAQNDQTAPRTRKPRAPRPQGENAAPVQHRLGQRFLIRQHRLRVRAARGRTMLRSRVSIPPHRARRASAAAAARKRARNIRK